MSAGVLALALVFAVLFSLGDGPARWHSFPAGVSIEQFRTQDGWWMLGALCIGLSLPVLARWPGWDAAGRLPRWGVIGSCSLLVLALSALGVDAVMHRFPLSVDEFLAVLQADAIRHGVFNAPIDAAWEPFAEAVQPLWVRIDRGRMLWGPGYRPGNALIIAAFGSVGLGPWTHAILGATVPVLGALVARQLFPAERWAPALTAVLLATSPQILFNAMTPYAMTPHLVASLAWLFLWLRDDAVGYVGAALVGFVAIGLHQVHIHPALAAPFLVHLLWRRRWVVGALMSVWYAASFGFWVAWRDLLMLGVPVVADSAHVESAFFLQRVVELIAERGLFDLVLWCGNAFRFIAWQNLAFLPLGLAGLATAWKGGVHVRLLALSVGVLLVPYVLLMPGQGHGWGYRYLHPVLGHLALLAVGGVVTLRRWCGPRWPLWRRGLVAAGVLSTLGALPLRGVQAESFVAPWADTSHWLSGLSDPVLVVDDTTVWFGTDLVRNDLFLEHRPILLAGSRLGPTALAALCKGGEVRVVGRDALQQFGLPEMPMRDSRSAADNLEARLADAGCVVRPYTPSAAP